MMASPIAPPTCWVMFDEPTSDTSVLRFDPAHRTDSEGNERQGKADADDKAGAEDVSEVTPVNRELRHPANTDREESQSRQEDRLDAKAFGERTAHPSDDDQDKTERSRGHAGLDGAIALHVLQVKREHEEQTNHGGGHEGHGDVGAPDLSGRGRYAVGRAARELCFRPRRPRAGRRRGRGGRWSDGTPSDGTGVDQRVENGEQSTGDQCGTDVVNGVIRCVGVGGPDQERSQRRATQSDGDIDEQHPPPTQRSGQYTTEDQADDTARSSNCAPDTEGLAALGSLFEEGDNDGARGRSQHGSAGPLDRRERRSTRRSMWIAHRRARPAQRGSSLR